MLNDEVKTTKSRDEVTKKPIQDEVTRMFRVVKAGAGGRSGNPNLVSRKSIQYEPKSNPMEQRARTLRGTWTDDLPL